MIIPSSIIYFINIFHSLLVYGGPDGELGAALRYLSQKFTMITPQAKAILNDIGTEESVPQGYQFTA